MNQPTLFPFQYEDLIRRALQEDLGIAGDLTTNSLISPEQTAEAKIISREEGRIAGLEIALTAFKLLDPGLTYILHHQDGDDVPANKPIVTIQGRARALLSAERTALNFLGRLSGIATATRTIVKTIEGYPTKIVCTRKTTPGLRILEKYAVRVGGGFNHRFALTDGILIKDNHKKLVGSLSEAIREIKKSVGHMVKIEVEVETLEELEEVLKRHCEERQRLPRHCEEARSADVAISPLQIHAILLDNMTPLQLKEAVAMAKGKVLLEASGNITLNNAREIASTGVDIISIGSLTHSSKSMDFSLEIT